MEELMLVKACDEYASQVFEYRQEFLDNGDSMDGCGPLRRCETIEEYMTEIAKYTREETVPEGKVQATQFWCIRKSDNRLVGMIQVRHKFNEYLAKYAGHIGYSIRPSERRKGYASWQLEHVMPFCRSIGLNKVMICCLDTNEGSRKTIIKNGGIFESKVYEEEHDESLERYWITLKEETIETDRLTLRRVMPSDYKEMSAWTMDERVYKYLLGNACKEPEEAMNFLRRNDPNSKKHYVFIEHAKADGHAIGLIAGVLDEETDTWNISYNCKYDDWGSGYTTEAAKALMDYVRNNNGAHRFEAECANENIGSAKVMQKLGMKFDHASLYTKRDGSVTFESSVYILED